MSARLMVVAMIVAPALAAPGVQAQPSPANSTLPPVIALVGKTGDTPDPAGYFQVVVRDALNAPIAGAKVLIDFGGCAQITIGSQQTYPGVTLEQCSPGTVSALTDGSGTARFVVMGCVGNRNAAEGAQSGCGVIRAEVGTDPPVQLGVVRVAAFDENGINGVRFEDQSLWLSDCSTPPICLGYHQRSDFDGDGFLTVNDLSALTAAICARRSAQTAPRCDGAPANNTARAADIVDLRLAWDDCRGGAGSTTKSFACNTNSGTRTLVASIRAPAGVNSLIGFDAELEVVGNLGVALPQWWRFESPTGCRSGALSFSGTGSFGCPDVGESSLCPGVDYPAPGGPPNEERIRLTAATSTTALTSGQEYVLIAVGINSSKTTGTGACADCNQPVAVVLQSVRLRQSADPDLAINILPGSTAAVAYWQGVPAGFSITDVSAGPSPTDWLAPPAPDPAAGPVTILFGLARESRVSLVVYDVAGRRVRVLRSGTLPAGEHAETWDGQGEGGERLAGGVFFLRLATGQRVVTRPIVRIR